MQKINKLLIYAKRNTIDVERLELKRALGRMTTEQLRELTADDIKDDRIFQIFGSVNALYLVKG